MARKNAWEKYPQGEKRNESERTKLIGYVYCHPEQSEGSQTVTEEILRS